MNVVEEVEGAIEVSAVELVKEGHKNQEVEDEGEMLVRNPPQNLVFTALYS